MRGSREEGQREMWCEGETEGRKEKRRGGGTGGGGGGGRRNVNRQRHKS